MLILVKLKTKYLIFCLMVSEMGLFEEALSRDWVKGMWVCMVLEVYHVLQSVLYLGMFT